MTPRPVAHVLPTITRLAGGPALSVRRLVESLQKQVPDFTHPVFASDEQLSRDALADWRGQDVRLFPTLGSRRWHWSPALRQSLQQFRPAIVHVHGLWQYHAYAAFRAAQSVGAPLLVSPRGMLEPWALRRGRLQKRLASVCFQRALLRHAAGVVVTAELEAEGVRQAGVCRPIHIVPNGVDRVERDAWAFQGGRAAAGPRRVLFLSRIEEKKGVLDLVCAWGKLGLSGWRLTIAGPSERGYADVVRRAIRSRQLEASIDLVDGLWGAAKREAFAAADIFVLPSYSENFGMVIGEALASGLPVITTRATPWPELERERCGWWIDVGTEPLTAALRAAVALSPEELKAMGGRGREMVERNFGWDAIAQQMAAVYRRVLSATTN